MLKKTTDDFMKKNKPSASKPTIGSNQSMKPKSEISSEAKVASDGQESNVTQDGDAISKKPYHPFSEEGFTADQNRQRGAATRRDTSFAIRKPRPNAYFMVHPDYTYTSHIFIDADED